MQKFQPVLSIGKLFFFGFDRFFYFSYSSEFHYTIPFIYNLYCQYQLSYNIPLCMIAAQLLHLHFWGLFLQYSILFIYVILSFDMEFNKFRIFKIYDE